MYVKIIFYYVCVLQLIYCSASKNFNSLPRDLCKLVACSIRLSSDVGPVFKLSKNDEQWKNRFVFPSTNSFQFVHPKIAESKDLVYPKSVKCGSYVVPSVQCLVYDNSYILSDLVLQKSVERALRVPVPICFFDLKNDKGVVLLCLPFEVAIIRDSLINTRCHLQFLSCKKDSFRFFPKSLCFHKSKPDLFSIIVNKSNNGCSLIEPAMLLFYWADKDYQEEIRLPQIMQTIKRHEYIGGNTFLLLDGSELFFMQRNGNQSLFSKQKILIYQLSKKEYSVVSFCVNQDDGEKTPGDRARYFFILAETETEDNRLVQVIFSVDLLDHYNTLTRIWSAEVDKNEAFDRIAYDNGVLSLWNDSIDNTAAIIIRLPLDWFKIVNNKLLFQEYYKDPKFLQQNNEVVLFKEDKKPDAQSLTGNDPVSTKYLFLPKYRFFLGLFVACFMVYCGMKIVQKSSAFLS